MPEATKPSSGAADWTDLINNWFAADAEWIQSRAILKWDTEAGIAAPSNVDGSLAYARDTQQLVLQAGSSKRHLFASSFLGYSESTGQVTFQHTSAPNGLDLLSSGTVRLAGGVLQAAAAGVSLKTGAATAQLTTDATDLISSLPLRATTFKGNLAGNVSGNVTGNVSGSISGGTLAGSALTVTGNGSVSGSLGVPFVNATTQVTTPLVANGTGDLRLIGGRILKNDGSAQEATVAAVVAASYAPTTEDMPEGTIWLVV